MYTVNRIMDNVYAFDEEQRTRCFLIVGTNRAMLLDTGIGMTDFNEAVPKITNLPVFLVNTHGDRDHVGHNEYCSERYCSEADYPLVKEKRPEGEEYKFIKEGDIIDIGTNVFEVIGAGGHTPGSIILYDRANKLLFSGDMVTSVNTFAFGKERDHQLMKKEFEKIMAMDLDVKYAFPCHNTYPVENFKELLTDTYAALCDYLEGRPETDIFELHLGPHTKKVKRYIHGCASMLLEEV